jgi:hypothetical protein
MRRIAKTIHDVKALLGDYNVELILHEEVVFLNFPVMEKYENTSLPDKYVPAHKPDEGSQFKEDSRCVIRSLVENPQFWRMTTVMDQMHGFVQFYDGKVYHGISSLKKKKNQLPTITFSSPKFAKLFYDFLVKKL